VEHRVEFDFEIEFTNGGGLQGQGFRLDIPGEEVTDDWIADALVRELGLLMVGPVRITNRRIIAEAHKRGAPAEASPPPASSARRLVDLSHPIAEGMTTYSGLPTPTIEPFLTREASAGKYAPGVSFAIDVITLCGNTGTYLDSPFHRHADGADLAGLPLDRLVAVPAVRVDVTGSRSLAIGARELLPYELRGRAVLVHTGFARHWGTDAYLRDNPFLAPDAVDLLVREGAALVGIDSLNIDSTSDPERPAHSRLLGAGIPIVEHLANLEAVPVNGATFTALPAPVRGTGTFPVRAVAAVPA
jgi:kynurenine formamidase